MARPAWAGPKLEDGALAAKLMPAPQGLIDHLTDLAACGYAPPDAPERIRRWLTTRDRSAWEVRRAIEQLRELIEDAAGRRSDAFDEGGRR